MHFDAGITISDLATPSTVEGCDSRSEERNLMRLIWAWYGYAELTVPNTNLRYYW